MTALHDAILAELTSPPRSVDPDDLNAWASMAGGCLRQIAWRIAGEAPPPTTPSALIAFRIGTSLHEVIQTALVKLYDAQVEIPWRQGLVSGRADALYTSSSLTEADGARTTVVEIKSVAPKAFAWATTHGPTAEHTLQALVSAVALHAQATHIIYINKQPGPDDRWLLEWEAALTANNEQIALDELIRLAQAAEYARRGEIAPPLYQGRLLTPAWTQWPCEYCWARARCMQLERLQ